MNNVTLIGRLTKDIELRKAGEYQVCDFVIACDKFVGGEKKADFINVQAWGKTAETLAKYVHKGEQIGVAGSLSVDNWERDGKKGTKTYVRVSNISLLDNGKTKPSDKSIDTLQPSDDTDMPF